MLALRLLQVRAENQDIFVAESDRERIMEVDAIAARAFATVVTLHFVVGMNSIFHRIESRCGLKGY